MKIIDKSQILNIFTLDQGIHLKNNLLFGSCKLYENDNLKIYNHGHPKYLIFSVLSILVLIIISILNLAINGGTDLKGIFIYVVPGIMISVVTMVVIIVVIYYLLTKEFFISQIILVSHHYIEDEELKFDIKPFGRNSFSYKMHDIKNVEIKHADTINYFKVIEWWDADTYFKKNESYELFILDEKISFMFKCFDSEQVSFIKKIVPSRIIIILTE